MFSGLSGLIHPFSLRTVSLIDFRMRKNEETNSEEKPCVRVGVWVGRGAGEGVLGRQASASGPARRSGGALVRVSRLLEGKGEGRQGRAGED